MSHPRRTMASSHTKTFAESPNFEPALLHKPEVAGRRIFSPGEFTILFRIGVSSPCSFVPLVPLVPLFLFVVNAAGLCSEWSTRFRVMRARLIATFFAEAEEIDHFTLRKKIFLLFAVIFFWYCAVKKLFWCCAIVYVFGGFFVLLWVFFVDLFHRMDCTWYVSLRIVTYRYVSLRIVTYRYVSLRLLYEKTHNWWKLTPFGSLGRLAISNSQILYKKRRKKLFEIF